MRFTIDSNILIYSFDAATPDKHQAAIDIVKRAMDADAVLTVQALGEVLSVIQRRYPAHGEAARAQAARWAKLFPLAPTQWEHVARAADFAARHRLQFWDSLIWQAARSLGASTFLSEDLQDGLTLDGMTVLDPFNPANAERLEEVLAPSTEPI